MMLSVAPQARPACIPKIAGMAQRVAPVSARPSLCTHAIADNNITPGPEAVLSGEWPATWSLLEYEDVLAFYQRSAAKQAAKSLPVSRLKDFMVSRKKLITCSPEDSLEDIRASGAFSRVSGLPVCRSDGVLLGVISRTDLNKPGSRVADIMSSPPIVARPNDTTTAAACLMLRYKVGRIPIVDDEKRCVGIVSRTDVFTALAVDSGAQQSRMDM